MTSLLAENLAKGGYGSRSRNDKAETKEHGQEEEGEEEEQPFFLV
jgi:hypothetical protein